MVCLQLALNREFIETFDLDGNAGLPGANDPSPVGSAAADSSERRPAHRPADGGNPRRGYAALIHIAAELGRG
ncbi:MAG: hypothetical protein QOK05_523 [Chloroflexota bacterium]|nr:hypothetical protein [Chloroflexota bacterium]